MKFLKKAAVVAVLLCALAAPASATTVRGDLSARFPPRQTVEVDGVTYQRREDVRTILFIGVDSTQEKDAARVGFRNGGQSDFLLLLVIDGGRETVCPVQIDRDTMLNMRTLDTEGNYAGDMFLQICLSHAFGDGKEKSCELACEAVENLLDAPRIDYYVAMNMDAIPALNDAVGGVTVTLQQDMTVYDPAMTQGATLTLSGQQAEYFVRSRYYVGTGLNEERMGRQRAYIAALADIVQREERQDANYIGRLYDEMAPMLRTNMSRGAMINTAWAARDYRREATVTPQGEHVISERGFVEFYADEQALQALQLSLFYEAVKEPGTP